MNAFRRFLSRLALGACLGAALPAVPALAQSVETPRLELTFPRGPASKPKTKATAAAQYNVWDEDDAEAAPKSPPKELAEPHKIKDTKLAREMPATRVVHEPRTVHDPRANPQSQPKAHRSTSYVPVGKRPKPPGFVPRHQRVIGAQYLSQDPEETLPTPPGEAETPGENGEMAPKPVPDANGTGGRRSIVNGRAVVPGVPQGMGPPGMGPSGMGPSTMMGDEFEGGMPFGGDPFHGSAEGGCCGAGGACAGGECGDFIGPFGGRFRECFPCLFVNLKDLDIFSGVHGFTNSTNRGGAGSFGYHVGFNKGRPLYCLPCSNLTFQFGVNAVFSNFDGAAFNNAGALATSPDGRNDVFLTGGLFRRVDWGLQFGMVFDYLHEDWYANMDIAQVRGELSWVYPNCHELGFWFAAGVNSGRDNAARIFVNGAPVNPPPVETWEAADLYAFFYRYRFAERGGEGRYFGGFTGDGDGLLGGDAWLPINNNWSIQAEYTYLIPSNNNAALAANANEAWNVSINMVWSPGFCRNNGGVSYNRPLFNVANHGSLILKRRP